MISYPANPTSANGSADRAPETDMTGMGTVVGLNKTMKIPLILAPGENYCI